MKQTWKQIGSLFLSVCMVVTMLPVDSNHINAHKFQFS